MPERRSWTFSEVFFRFVSLKEINECDEKGHLILTFTLFITSPTGTGVIYHQVISEIVKLSDLYRFSYNNIVTGFSNVSHVFGITVQLKCLRNLFLFNYVEFSRKIKKKSKRYKKVLKHFRKFQKILECLKIH